MALIHVLDKQTVDQIAAGEVVERPSSVVKELVENAIDAGATAVTVEVKNGGIDLIRVTDNGSGIAKDEIRTAFLRHATSKIGTAADLEHIGSLGFRGEALSSIAAVTQLEVITKKKDQLTAASYEINGGEEAGLTEIGAPDGTTFLVKNIFYNTPARRKFLKTAMTETSYIADLMERFSLSHPEISFRFLSNGSTKLATSGNGKLKDLIYTIYGRDTANAVLPVNYDDGNIRISGFLGKPVIAKGNRGFENYFINGRYVKSNLICKAIEEAYAPFMMQHRYPFVVLYIELPPEEFDVNVHPTKMELRFRKEAAVYDAVLKAVKQGLEHKEFVPDAVLTEEKQQKEKIYKTPEPFEVNRLKETETVYGEKKTAGQTEAHQKTENLPEKIILKKDTPEKTFEDVKKTEEVKTVSKIPEEPGKDEPQKQPESQKQPEPQKQPEQPKQKQPEQPDLFDLKLISDEGMKKHRLIGQVFETYWLIQLEDKLYILDQHAAHEKVLYERKMKELREKKFSSQIVSPPVMISVTARESLLINRYMNDFAALGYEISSFGGREYSISAVPADILGLDVRSLFEEILGELSEDWNDKEPELVLSKLASMSCKAAVKGNHLMSFEEADHLIAELLTLENPYACPHGRPTMISLTKTELEKKFKRIV